MTAPPSPPSPIGRRLGKQSVGPSTFHKVWTEKAEAEECEGQERWKKNMRASAGCLGLNQRNQTDVPVDNWATPTPLRFPERDQIKKNWQHECKDMKVYKSSFWQIGLLTH